MTERRLLILESYYTTKEPNKQQWRLTNAPGLPFHDNLNDYMLYQPAFCKPGVVDEVSKVISLMSSSGDEWKFIGVLIKGPRGNVIQMDGERYRRAVIEKVLAPAPPHSCPRCGTKCLQTTIPQVWQGAAPGYPIYGMPA